MSPEVTGILIGACSLLAAAILTALGAAIIRLWRTPKRIDRLERMIPPLTRGVWALLGEHVRDSNGDSSQEIKDAYAGLTDIVTDGVVSQKENK